MLVRLKLVIEFSFIFYQNTNPNQYQEHLEFGEAVNINLSLFFWNVSKFILQFSVTVSKWVEFLSYL